MVVICLLLNGCQDEDSGLELIPVLIEPVDSIPRAYSHVPIIDGVEYFDKSTAIIMTAIVKYRTSGERNLRVFHDQEVCLKYRVYCKYH